MGVLIKGMGCPPVFQREFPIRRANFLRSSEGAFVIVGFQNVGGQRLYGPGQLHFVQTGTVRH